MRGWGGIGEETGSKQFVHDLERTGRQEQNITKTLFRNSSCKYDSNTSRYYDKTLATLKAKWM